MEPEDANDKSKILEVVDLYADMDCSAVSFDMRRQLHNRQGILQ